MGVILRQIEKIYSNTLFRRHDMLESVYYFSCGDFPGLKCCDMPFLSRRGHKLAGRFYYYNNPIEDKIIIFEHGLSPGHRSYMREIEMLCRHGYAVFTYDHTGSGISEGEHVRGLCGSLPDLDDCIGFLNSLDALRGKKLCVLGHSRGGYSTLNILPLRPEVDRIVAMSGFISLRAMQRQIAPFLLSPFRKFIFELERKHNPEYVDRSALDSLSSSDRPALIIHSADDPTVRIRGNFDLLKKHFSDRPNTCFLLLTDRAHNPTFTKEAVLYKSEFYKEQNGLKKKGLLDEIESARLISSYDWYKMTQQDSAVWDEIFAFLDR